VPTNTLSDSKCKAAKPAERAYKLFDGHGLFLYVSPAGGKIWRMAYRAEVDGKQKPQTATFGPYPLITLQDARAKRDALRLRLVNGEPAKPKEHRAAKRINLKDAAEQYWNGRQDISDKYRQNAMNALEAYITPRLGKSWMDEIGREDVLEVLKVMDVAGKFSYVRKVRGWLSSVFDWAMANSFCTVNPCELINTRKAFGHRKVVSFAALEVNKVAEFMKRLELEGLLQSAIACKLMALTGVRTKELRMMRLDEIDGALWRIPAARMKKDLDLLVPLSRQALEIVEHMKARNPGTAYLFPNDRDKTRPMSENAVLYLIGRMGYGGEMTGHGWRTVMSTWLNEHGFDKDAIERQLAHVPSDKVRGIYNRAEFMPERRRMMQAWADWLVPDRLSKALHSPASSDANIASSVSA
jgi:integrase